ncbi:TPA: hypothetical protein DIC20_05395 [Candidatus Dependentiae bacterium]|nr:MAG: hypothetical protein US03_C0005G0036 [candidate division TM6 bacterium GW2011_GWF2_36_131]KKQ03125.1 MAG: hypothetical protein US13_C0005G0009 [candidate division TM6 bacterium GW2011_GWE2_36_25]KKQ19387.1 MAG: hypothetical protein US32_C0010G0036 [candidate division TM6 bacterium GW2011_GWA2_36_9]HBR71026.1 hypothetical protein [Candidatus Dependentiae bacterium]HCU01100.1 hypothetical protein [Candidatus Dependentiae bacterium]
MKNFDNYFTKKWQLQKIKPLPKSPFTHNLLFSALSSRYNCAVILKIFPSRKDFLHEQRALEYFNGIGCAQLIDYDTEKCGLLLEEIKPGTQLSTFFPREEDKATEYAAQVIKKLHSKPLAASQFKNFPKINNWLNLLNTFKDDKMSPILLQKAQTLAQKLLNSQGDLYLLHGDLHHENILKHNDSWIAIDPKGVIGELAYEFGAFIRNPIPALLEQRNPLEIMLNRALHFSTAFGINKQQILEWSFVQAVLAACWAIQGNSQSPDYWIKIAQMLNNQF